MSTIKSKVLAACATLTLVSGVGAAGAITAGTAAAATPSCGPTCVDPFSYQFGTHKAPNYVMDVFRQGNKVGQPVILFRSSNNDPAEDFTGSLQGTVSDFFAAGLVSSAVDLHYGGTCEVTSLVAPVLSAPAIPLVTQSTSGSSLTGNYSVEVTWVNASGETVASLPASVTTTGATSTITIHRPPTISGADGWNVYIATGTGAYYLQNTSPLALGTNHLTITVPPLSPTSTPLTSSITPPKVNTATTGAPVPTCTKSYPDLYAWELQYAPYGVDSGLCVGLASTAVSGEGVTLQPCGVSAKTVWITDTVNAAGWGNKYVPVINGSDTNFSQPYVLDYPHNGFPTDKPRPQLYVDNLTGFSNGSFLNWSGIIDTQEWGADFGALP